jgi:hypothetical protein
LGYSFLLVLRKGEEFINRGLFIQAKGQQRKTRYIFKDICPPLGCDNIDELKYQSPILRVAHFVFFDVKVSSTLTTAVPSTEKTGEKQLGPVNAPAALLYVRSLSAVAGQTNVGRCRGQVSRGRVAARSALPVPPLYVPLCLLASLNTFSFPFGWPSTVTGRDPNGSQQRVAAEELGRWKQLDKIHRQYHQ